MIEKVKIKATSVYIVFLTRTENKFNRSFLLLIFQKSRPSVSFDLSFSLWRFLSRGLGDTHTKHTYYKHTIWSVTSSWTHFTSHRMSTFLYFHSSAFHVCVLFFSEGPKIYIPYTPWVSDTDGWTYTWPVDSRHDMSQWKYIICVGTKAKTLFTRVARLPQ